MKQENTDNSQPAQQAAPDLVKQKNAPASSRPVSPGHVVERNLKSSPLIVTLIIVLIAAVVVQSAFLIAAYYQRKEDPTTARVLRAEAEELVQPAVDPDGVQTLKKNAPVPPVGSVATDDFFLNGNQPFAEMARMREEMNRVFENSFKRFSELPGFDEQWLNHKGPSISSATIKDKGDNCIVTLDVPGADKGSLKLKLENNILSVSGTQKEVHESKDAQGHVNARSSSVRQFTRSFSVPGDLDAAGMTSQYKKDTLTITIPKSTRTAKH